MLKLMKYEFRKSWFSKVVLLIITAVAEALFLFGMFARRDGAFAWGLTILAVCAFAGIIYVGVESLNVFHRDLNTKQSYMLFMTPKNSYQILGAKVLSNAASLAVTGLFFALLALLDIAVSIWYLDGLQTLIEAVQQFLHIRIDWNEAGRYTAFVIALGLSTWLMVITAGDLAIVLSATVLAGKKFSGFVSFVICLLILWLCSALLNYLPEPSALAAEFCLHIGGTLLLTAALYAGAGYIMEKKLSV